MQSEFGVWPDNQPAIALYNKCFTQLRSGAAGPIGLDHNIVFHHMGRMALDAEAYDALFDDIRVMEAEFLAVMREQAEEAARRRKS